MNALKGLKGFKGLTTVGLLLSAIFVLVVSVFYIIPALADSDTITSASVTPANVTQGQKLPSLNFSFNVGSTRNITQIAVNFSVIGNTAGNFTVPASNDSVVCGGRTINLAGWLSRINATAVTCYNATADNGAGSQVFNVSIVNTTVGIYAGSVRGLYQFNISIIINDTTSNMNSTLVGVDVKKIAGRATTNVTSAEIGKNQSISFTITNPAESDKDINKIVINFTSAGFVAPTQVSCPGIGNGGNGWGAATIGANDVTCSRGDGGVFGIGSSTTIILNGTTAGQTPGIQPFYVGLYDTTVGEYANFTNSTTVAVYGLLNITGTNTAPSLIFINKNSTDNGTQFIRFNFSTRGEGMNITALSILRTGTAAAADIIEVALYNSTPAADSDIDPSYANVQLIAKNTSVPDSLGRYDFTGFRWNISGTSDSVDQYLYVVANVSRSATAGRTIGFMINNTGNVSTTSAISGQSITEALVTTSSGNATIVGNITITGTDGLPAAITAGATNVSVITFNFAPSGEQVNITNLTLTRTGTATDSDIVAVGLYNSSSDGSNVFTANATLIAWNTTPDSLGRYAFNDTNFNVSTSGNRLLVVVNISSTAVATRTIGFLINGTGNVTSRTAVSNQLLTETLVTTSSSNATLGNLTITGANTAPSTILLNKNSTDNITQFIRFNFSTSGEGVNITSVTILRTGTATDADVLTVAIYNSTAAADTDTDPLSNVQLIARNTSAPDSLGRYTFTSFQWNVSTYQYLYVVANITRGATGGRTVGFMINNTGNVTTTGAVSAQGVSEFLITGASNNATIVGNITITGTTSMPAAITVGATNVSVITFNFAPSGEQANITNLTITRTGTATDADIVAVGLYNSSSDGSNVFTANATLIAWNTTPDSLGRYDFNDTNFNVSTSGNRLLVVVNISSNAVATRTIGFMINGTGNVTSRTSVSNQLLTETLVTEASNNATLGNLTITGTNTAPSTILLNKNGTQNITQFVRFNISTRGEGANITSITILRTGTATDADVLAVEIYNSTPAAASSADTLSAVQLIARNTSAPDSLGRYTFTSFQWNISGSSDSVDQYLYVVANLTRGATGGRTVGFMINNTGNVTTTGAVSAQTVSEFLVTGASNNATIVGNITITGTSDAPGGILAGATNVSAIRFTFDATGEQMNVTTIVLTRTGNVQDADIPAVAIYNTSSDGANVFTANATLIAWNTSAPDSLGRYTFAVGLNVSATTDNVLLVVFNSSSSAVAPRAVGFMINGTGNITTTSGVSNQGVTETLVTTASANTTIAGNITITGTSRIPSTVAVGTRNITVISYNFTTNGEGMNITGINLTLTGTVSTTDIEAVSVYNGTVITFSESSTTMIASNSSAPRADGTYSFSGIGFNVTASDADGNVLLVVVNFTAGSGTSGGKTIGFKLNPAANTSVTGAVSGIAITPTLTTTSSSNATIVGNLTVFSTADVSANVKINQKKVTFLNLTFLARGEQVNVTNINLTLRGNASFANVSEIRLFNDDGSANGTLDASDTLIAGTVTIPSSSRLAITPTSVIALAHATAKTLFVVFNISDESDAGAVAGIQINSTDVAALTNTTVQPVSTNWSTITTANRTIQSNIGQQAVGGVTGWYTLNIPSQTIMESIGRTAGTTQTFNISKILYSLRTNYRFVYYNTDGTSSGWKLFDRTDWAGSSLQYANNTNDKVYWVNMTAEDTFEL